MPSPPRWLLYGANGYTGRIIAEATKDWEDAPLLAGRNAEAIPTLGAELGLSHVVVNLDDPEELNRVLSSVEVVLHCAGPFAHTAAPMAEACIQTGTHYLDITGEISVFEAMARWNRKAFDAGVMLLPGVGFDVIPSDCLAAHLVDRLPGADRLTLAFTGQGGVSHGTATTAVQNLHLGGAVRTDGRIRPVPAAYRSLQVDFGAGFVNTVTVPWGDVSTAWYTTGIQDIRVYMQVPGSVHRMMWMSRWFKGLLASDWGQKKLAAYVDENIVGPDATTRATGHATIWGEAGDRHGNLVEARVHTREAYQTTADGALLVLRKVLAGQSHPGYQTPAGAYGPDLVLELEGASREDL